MLGHMQKSTTFEHKLKKHKMSVRTFLPRALQLYMNLVLVFLSLFMCMFLYFYTAFLTFTYLLLILLLIHLIIFHRTHVDSSFNN